MYEIKNGKSYYYPLLLLRYTYNIPECFEKSYLKNFYIKYAALTLYSLLILWMMPVLHLIMSIKDDTGVDITEDISVSVGDSGCIVICLLFTLQYRKWSEFFTDVTTIKKYEKYDAFTNIENFIMKSNRYSIIFLCYMFSGVGIYGAIGISGSSECKRLNEEKGLHESCLVFHPIWLPFDTNDVFSTVTIFMIQGIAIIHALPASGVICFMILESAEILILHINILKENFINLFEETSNQQISAKLRFCINYHNHILWLGKRFNLLQRNTVGPLSFIITIIIACILNQTRNTKPLGAVMYLLACVVGVALICHAGQRIIDQTISVGNAVYASNWHKADSKTKKDLAVIILRCQKPIYLHAIPFGIYNYALFVMILRTSYSYWALFDEAT